MFSGHSWSNFGKYCAFCMKCATKSLLFALFWRGSGGYAMPEGCYVNQGAGGVTPKNIRREQKSHFFGCA
jgi:hypothetical protein